MELLIIEDEKILLEKYSNYAFDLFSKVHTASSINEATTIYENHFIDCILSDNILPDGKGIDLINKIREQDDNIPIIIITAYADKELAISSVNSGINVFLEKPVSREQVTNALQKCLSLIESNRKTESLYNKFEISEKAKLTLINDYDISTRELEIIQLMLHLHNNKCIAKKLFISPGTVKNHLSNIFQKLHISSKEEAKEFVRKLNQI